MKADQVISNVVRLAQKRPVAILPCGLPGSGKSTFARKLMQDLPIQVFSTDDLVMRAADEQGKSYSEVFPTLNFADLVAEMQASVQAATAQYQDIWIDQTHVRANLRRTNLALIPANYCKIALVFFRPMTLIRERVEARKDKFIPWEAIQKMDDESSLPEFREGFDFIYSVDE